jgi:hypothetical protein
MMPDDRANLVKELATATSTQTQVSNRSWLALITVSVLAVLPESQNPETPLPLGLGNVSTTWFHFVMFSLLVVLSIAFAAAHAQQVRAQRLSNFALDGLGEQPLSELRVHPRDLFDILRVPSVNRLAPIAQLFQGMDAFYGSGKRPPRWRKTLSIFYYLALKVASWLVYFGFPVVALWFSFDHIPWRDWRYWALVVAGAIATLPILHVFLVDVVYVAQVSRVIGVEHRRPADRRVQQTTCGRIEEVTAPDRPLGERKV